MTQCNYYYHSWSSARPRRCKLDEGHTCEHIVEQDLTLQQLAQNIQPTTGWRKH